ncbi:cytosine permease [Halomonas saccharevitans]|uniref:Purine-cytosine permease n=1 Tax=Halomonas saccharevitans TaxID=416872 RepID=A0A1I6ZPS8_9GAMM|nr:cytosine permease [Halomonas saccharevitans]SFT64708.1 Purine-cytosine permease [Halomonas saccharevitans]
MSRATEATGNSASGFQVAIILLGILVTPVVLASSSLGSQLTLGTAAIAIAAGSIILALLAAINISIGERARMPTYGIVKYSFGRKGAVAINILMAISLFGWIAVTANTFGHSAHDLLARQFGLELPIPAIVTFGCVIFVASTAFGFEALGKVARFAVPIIALLMFYILYLALTSEVPPAIAEKVSDLSFGAAVSSIVGTIIVLVATSPDFGAFVHNRKHAIIAGLLTFGVAYPVLFLVGAVPGSMTSQDSLLAAMAIIGTTLPATILLIFACITGNAGNMFQGTLVVSTLFSAFAKWKITVALGVLAAVVGSMDIMGWFIPFLLFLGIATPPVCGIYIADYLVNRRKGFDEARLDSDAAIKPRTFVAWGVASFVGFCTVNGWFTLSGIPSVDSILVAFLGYVLLSRVGAGKSAAQTS